MKSNCILLLSLVVTSLTSPGQSITNTQKQGNLFIIGGGDRSLSLMKSLIAVAELQAKDYIVVLPMSGEEPDTSFYYIKEDLQPACSNTIANLNFTKEKINDTKWLDSLQQAKLIFITGGDQSRFMNIVLHTPVHAAIKKAFENGATIAGTSAGAAVMSRQMITGNDLLGDSVGTGSFTKISYNMVEVKEGLGLVNSAVIDQHFIARSRYNRLLSVLAAFPKLQCIGIDEATAIIINGKKVTVKGASQVIRMRLPATKKITLRKNNIVRLQEVRLDILTEGDTFMLD